MYNFVAKIVAVFEKMCLDCDGQGQKWSKIAFFCKKLLQCNKTATKLLQALAQYSCGFPGFCSKCYKIFTIIN